MLVYKVVTAGSRRSCLVPGTSPFCLTYEKNTIVEAHPDTIGVMCFETENHALTFGSGDIDLGYWKMIIVDGLGKATYPEVIARDYYTSGIRWFIIRLQQGAIQSNSYRKPIPGTICFPRVKVMT